MFVSRKTGKFLLLLGLALVVFYSPILFSSQFSILTGFDSAAMDYPWYNYIAFSLKHGSIPFWDPYTQGGRSFIGETATGAFSPTRLASIWLLSKDGTISPRSMHVVYVFLHALAAGLMFVLARTLGLGRFAALLAGLCFSVAGFTGRASWFDMLDSAVWLPLIFLLQLKALYEKDRLRGLSYALCAALAMGMTALAGRVHIVIMDALLVIAAGIFFAIHAPRDRENSAPRKNRWVASGLVVAIIGIVGFAAAAVQLVPSMEYAPQVMRWIRPDMAVAATSKIPYAYLHDGYSPRALFAFLFPFVDVGQGEGFSPYFGILPFCLALIGVWKNWGNRWVRFLAGAVIVSLFFSLGGLSFLHRLAYFFVPYLWIAREPSRFLYLTHFAAAILAGFGADTVFSRADRRASLTGFMNVFRWCVISSTAIVGTLTLLRRPEANDWIVLSFLFLVGDYLLLAAIDRGYRTAGAAFLVVAITLCEVGIFSWNIANVDEIRVSGNDHLDRLFSLRPVISYLKSQPGLFRVSVDADHEPNIGDAYQVQTTGGMSATALKSYDKLLHQCGRLDMLNVRYLIRQSKAPGKPLYEAGGWKIVENVPAYPRAWLVHDAVVQPEQEIFKHMCERDFDAYRTALLESPLEAPLQPNAKEDLDQVVIRSYDANRIEVEAQARSRALLVMSEMYYPGWKAEVDGATVTIHKVDGALRGIVVPAGNSRVVLHYAPRSVALGASLSLLAFIGVLVFGAVTWLRTKTDHAQAEGAPIQSAGS
jgi:hypothetical protein